MVSARTVADLTDTDISLPTGNALVFAEIDEVFEDTPTRLVAIVLVVMSVLTALMWLGQDVPALMSGQVPSDVLEAGLLTNPTHVLDLGLVLPACVVTGFLLARRRAWGFVLVRTSW